MEAPAEKVRSPDGFSFPSVGRQGWAELKAPGSVPRCSFFRKEGIVGSPIRAQFDLELAA
jgi:hypothetical protein